MLNNNRMVASQWKCKMESCSIRLDRRGNRIEWNKDWMEKWATMVPPTHLVSPVHLKSKHHTHPNICRKFSAVRGHLSLNNSIFIRPIDCPPMVTSINTTGFGSSFDMSERADTILSALGLVYPIDQSSHRLIDWTTRVQRYSWSLAVRIQDGFEWNKKADRHRHWNSNEEYSECPRGTYGPAFKVQQSLNQSQTTHCLAPSPRLL